jgi:diguanylate cyclase (GGDEF)-like protein
MKWRPWRSATESASVERGRAQPELLVSVILVVATLLLILNITAMFGDARFAGGMAPHIGLIILVLNVALILVGLRRLADLQHEVERRADAARRAAHLATTDLVTGLANRKGLADQAQELYSRLAGEGRPLVVVTLQLHRFKTINDRHGHALGDQLLTAIGAAIGAIAPADAIVARLNGGEFAIAFAPDEHGAAPEKVATEILRRVTAPFDIGGRLLQVGAYAGLAEGNAETTALPDVLRRADIALERARSARAARPIWFDEGMERALIAHVEVEQGIRYALEHNQFVPFFEPQVDLGSGAVIGFEVLARWNHPLSGLILPETFIPVAEEHGLIARLSEQVIAEALRTAAAWPGECTLSVNISPTQLADPWLAQRLVRLLAESNFPPHRLVVEITESSLFADLELARSIIANLKSQGIRLALDDFGTGFSSLAHLRSLPFDMIKIDRSFTASVNQDAESAAIVRAVTDLARAIKVPVTVEGIEDAATHATVLGFGCAFGQGWYFGKAMSASEALQLLDQPGERAATVRRATS